MLIDESRDTLKKYVIGFMIANIVAFIGLFFTVVFFTAHIWMGGIVAYGATCIVISINLCSFAKFYSKLKN